MKDVSFKAILLHHNCWCHQITKLTFLYFLSWSHFDKNIFYRLFTRMSKYTTYWLSLVYILLSLLSKRSSHLFHPNPAVAYPSPLFVASIPQSPPPPSSIYPPWHPTPPPHPPPSTDSTAAGTHRRRPNAPPAPPAFSKWHCAAQSPTASARSPAALYSFSIVCTCSHNSCHLDGQRQHHSSYSDTIVGPLSILLVWKPITWWQRIVLEVHPRQTIWACCIPAGRRSSTRR